MFWFKTPPRLGRYRRDYWSPFACCWIRVSVYFGKERTQMNDSELWWWLGSYISRGRQAGRDSGAEMRREAGAPQPSGCPKAGASSLDAGACAQNHPAA